MPALRLRVVIRGGGDLGSGIALRLWRAGFEVAVLEISAPVAVRRTVSFSEAVYEGGATVEEARATLVTSVESALDSFDRRDIPVLIDPGASSVPRLRPDALVDARMLKRNMDTHRDMAPCVVCVGPGFQAGVDCDAVVETNRGPHLGRVIWRGSAQPDTGTPSPVQGATSSRVLRAPTEGKLRDGFKIGSTVRSGDVVARVDDYPVPAGLDGILRGMARDGLSVRAGMKIGDIDPRMDPDLCYLVSEKSLAVAGGVIEAVMMSVQSHA